MIKFIHLIYKFIICLLLSEARIFFVRLSYCKYFFLNINFLKYFFYIFDKNINPIKTDEFLKFLEANKKKWKKIEKNKKIKNTKKIIIIENFVNHPIYTINNISKTNVSAFQYHKIHDFNN